MGGVLSQLCYLLVQHRCRPSSLASSLTFVPPDPPYYVLKEKGDGSGGLECELDPIMAGTSFPGVEINILKTSRGTYIPSFLYRHPQAQLTVLFSHGNASDCGAMWERYVGLVQRTSVNVFAYDYSGYGAASGQPSEANTYADIEAAYDFLVEKGICTDPANQIVLYGQSVGSGPSCKLASSKKRPVRGIILHSPFTSGLRVIVKNRGPLACCDIYPNINRIGRVSAPVLVIHGEEDQEVHCDHGKLLHAKVPTEHRRDPCWLPNAGHNDIVDLYPDHFYQTVGRFLRSLESGDTSPEIMVMDLADLAAAAPAPPQTAQAAPTDQVALN
mmetsp:Transcript_18135/g.33508  ORF Transcript_18135/g.33508 Transcript_18135/m.33508 type:complete len:329 (+) Transcript_18135:101-1087(+)